MRAALSDMPVAERLAAVLHEPKPDRKARMVRAAAGDWRRNSTLTTGRATAPDRPARPKRPELRRPGDMPKRRASGGAKGRIALLHALAHIELNAIDLACDIIVRFADNSLPRDFVDDWLRVADEEGKHYLLLEERLRTLGATYGDLPARDGLWQAAGDTRHDLLARLAIVPLVLEARGLDVTPTMIDKLQRAGDDESAAVLEIIYRDEIGHVGIGKTWFDYVCQQRGLAPKETWQTLVEQHFRGDLKPPFNEAARAEAGFPLTFIRTM